MRGLVLRALTAACGVCVCSLALAAPAIAVTFTVDDLGDEHDTDFAGVFDGVCDATGAAKCTLRAALEEANDTLGGSDTIDISVAGKINLANGPLAVAAVATVNGNAAGTIIDAGGTTRVLSAGSSSVTLNDLRLEDGATLDADGAGIQSSATLLTMNRVTVAGNTVNSSSGGNAGGGIVTLGLTSSLVLNDSTVSGNTVIGLSGLGGGIRADGPLTLNRSTISGNSATLDAGGRGGGIDHNPISPVALTISNSTISDNHSGSGGGGGVFTTGNVTTSIVGSTITANTTTGEGGGLRLQGPAASSENTIYAANTATVGGAECGLGSGFAASENNIDAGTTCGFGTADGNQESVGAGALGLGVLASNGGPTRTHALAAGSVAQNAASGDCGGLLADQRGVARPQGPACDVGAFELEPPLPPASSPPPATAPVAKKKKKCKKGFKLKKIKKKGKKPKKKCVKVKKKKKKAKR